MEDDDHRRRTMEDNGIYDIGEDGLEDEGNGG